MVAGWQESKRATFWAAQAATKATTATTAAAATTTTTTTTTTLGASRCAKMNSLRDTAVLAVFDRVGDHSCNKICRALRWQFHTPLSFWTRPCIFEWNCLSVVWSHKVLRSGVESTLHKLISLQLCMTSLSCLIVGNYWDAKNIWIHFRTSQRYTKILYNIYIYYIIDIYILKIWFMSVKTLPSSGGRLTFGRVHFTTQHQVVAQKAEWLSSTRK